jgi:hypothetical protein
LSASGSRSGFGSDFGVAGLLVAGLVMEAGREEAAVAAAVAVALLPWPFPLLAGRLEGEAVLALVVVGEADALWAAVFGSRVVVGIGRCSFRLLCVWGGGRGRPRRRAWPVSAAVVRASTVLLHSNRFRCRL